MLAGERCCSRNISELNHATLQRLHQHLNTLSSISKSGRRFSIHFNRPGAACVMRQDRPLGVMKMGLECDTRWKRVANYGLLGILPFPWFTLPSIEDTQSTSIAHFYYSYRHCRIRRNTSYNARSRFEAPIRQLYNVGILTLEQALHINSLTSYKQFQTFILL